MSTALYPVLPEPDHPFNMWEAAKTSARRTVFNCVRAHPRCNVLLEMVRLVTGTSAAQCRDYIRQQVQLRNVVPMRNRPKVVLSQALTGSWTGTDEWTTADVRGMAALVADLTDAHVIVYHQDDVTHVNRGETHPVLLWVVKGWFARLDPDRDLMRQVASVANKK